MTSDEIISRLNDINADLLDEIDQLKQQRDEAWAVAREILAELGYPHRIAQFEQEHPRLKEEPAG